MFANNNMNIDFQEFPSIKPLTTLKQFMDWTEIKKKEGRISHINDIDKIEIYRTIKVYLTADEETKARVKKYNEKDFELYEQGILEDIMIPYDEIYIYSTKDYTNPKESIGLIHIKRSGGILVKDIAHIVFDLISYPDASFYYEGLEYYGEYLNQPLYVMQIGT